MVKSTIYSLSALKKWAFIVKLIADKDTKNEYDINSILQICGQIIDIFDLIFFEICLFYQWILAKN